MKHDSDERDQCSKILDRKVLDCVDADIAEACNQMGEGCWAIELPLQMQTARYLKRLYELMALREALPSEGSKPNP